MKTVKLAGNILIIIGAVCFIAASLLLLFGFFPTPYLPILSFPLSALIYFSGNLLLWRAIFPYNEEEKSIIKANITANIAGMVAATAAFLMLLYIYLQITAKI